MSPFFQRTFIQMQKIQKHLMFPQTWKYVNIYDTHIFFHPFLFSFNILNSPNLPMKPSQLSRWYWQRVPWIHHTRVMRNCYTKRRNAWKQQDFRCGVGSDGSAIRRDVFLRKEVFFFANQVIMSLKFWGSLVCFFLVVLGFGLWIYEGLQNQKLESCSSISRCLPQGFLRLVLLSLHSCESGEPAFWHVGQVGYPSGTTWLAACTPCFFSLRFSHVFRQVWAAWMSPSHDGYVGPKAISKRTVPLGLMFRCDEGSCFTSTRS